MGYVRVKEIVEYLLRAESSYIVDRSTLIHLGGMRFDECVLGGQKPFESCLLLRNHGGLQ